jgi:hypothetical protein
VKLGAAYGLSRGGAAARRDTGKNDIGCKGSETKNVICRLEKLESSLSVIVRRRHRLDN